MVSAGPPLEVAGERLPSQEIVLARAVISLVLSGGLLLHAGLPLLGTNRRLLLVAKPGNLFGVAESLDFLAVALAVGGAFFSGVAYTLVRRLSQTENPLTIVFYFPLVTVPLSLPTVMADFVMPNGWEWAMLLGVGVFTQLGQVWLTRGIQIEPAGRATALSYMQVLFATIWGVLFFNELPDGYTLAGSLLILAGAFINIRKG